MNKIIALNQKEIGFVFGGITEPDTAASTSKEGTATASSSNTSWKDWAAKHTAGIAVGFVVITVTSIALLKLCCWAVPISKDLNDGG